MESRALLAFALSLAILIGYQIMFAPERPMSPEGEAAQISGSEPLLEEDVTAVSGAPRPSAAAGAEADSSNPLPDRRDEQLTTVFPRGAIVCGSTGMGSTGIAEGAVREAGQGLTALAPSDGLWTSNKRAVANSLQDAGFEVDCHDDAVSLVWSKAVLNAAINPVTVLHNILNGGILERAEAHVIMRAAAREAQSVAESMGIALHYEDAVTQAERVCAQTEKNVSSMLQDYRTGRRTEIQNINGEIVRAAIAQGLPAPVNASLVERVLTLSAAQ